MQCLMLAEITLVGQREFDYKLLLSPYGQELSLPSVLSILTGSCLIWSLSI